MDSSLSHHTANQAPQFVLANTQEENSFDFWGVLNRRKWLVFLGLVTGLGLGGLYHAQCEEVFESRAQVKIEPKNPPVFRVTNTDVVGPSADNMVTRHDRFIGGYNIVYKCLTENELLDLPSFNDIPEREVVEYVRENLDIRPDKEEPVLYDLKFWCNNREDVSMVLNHLIATYRSKLDDEYKIETDKYAELLNNVESNFKGAFEQLQVELRETQKLYDVPRLGNGRNVHVDAITALNNSMQKSRELVSNYTALKSRTMDALANGPEDINNVYWSLIQNEQIRDFSRLYGEQGAGQIELRINAMRIELDALLGKYGPRHPDVKRMKTGIERWVKYRDENQGSENLMANVDPQVSLERFLLSLNERIADEQAILDQYTRDYIKHEKEAKRLAAIDQTIDAIQSEIKDVNEMIKITSMKIVEVDPSMELNNRARSEGFSFDVIMDATKGEVVWPILPAILGIGGLLGLLGGFGLGCLVELADKTFHNPDEIMKQLQIPLIGHIPVIGQSKRYLVENSLIEPIVCTYHRPKSQVSESFRAVRTSLYFNTQGKQHSVIQITSPTPGDGKSTLASNLAVSIAQSGKRVLLVDGDMRRPRQATTFGISSKTGFATVLAGESQWRDVVYECEEIEGLTVMPCGAKPNNPAELSSSPQVKELIEEMRQEFDFVIIDTPPMLAVTDACPIAARVDGVILCIRIKKNVRVSAERATEMLTNLGANCIGLVVNGVGAQSGYGSQYTYGAYRAGYSYNGYGYGYGYGYGAGKYYDDDQNRPVNPNGTRNIESQRAEHNPPVV